MSAKAVIQADSAIHKEALEAAAGTWDGEQLQVSKFAENLEQLDNGVKIPPSGLSLLFARMFTFLMIFSCRVKLVKAFSGCLFCVNSILM